MKSVAVVIPTWNGAEMIPACLSALRHQTRPPNQVITVDNGSMDDSADLLAESFPEVEVVRFDRNRGFAAAVNAGIRACDCEFIALLNNDAEPEPGWLKALVGAAEGERVGMVASKIVDAGDPLRIDGIGLEVDAEGNPHQIGRGESDGGEFDEPREVFGPIGAAALYRRELFDDVGLFDEDFISYLEDVDLAWRARRAGWRCMYAPGAVVRHARTSTARRIPRRIRYLIWRNFVWLVVKNAEPAALLRFAFRQPLRDLIEVGRLIAAGRAGDAVVLVAARVAAVLGLPKMLRRRSALGAPGRRPAAEVNA